MGTDIRLKIHLMDDGGVAKTPYRYAYCGMFLPKRQSCCVSEVTCLKCIKRYNTINPENKREK